MCKVKAYQVVGDMTAEKSSDAYPMMDLCDECVGSYETLSVESPMGKTCESCGCEDNTAELEDRKTELEGQIEEIHAELESDESNTELEEQLEDLQQELNDIEEQLAN